MRPDDQVIDIVASTALLAEDGPQGKVFISHVQDITEQTRQTGDELLVTVTSRLTGADPRWRVCRLGGDEFVIVIPGISTLSETREEGRSLAATHPGSAHR